MNCQADPSRNSTTTDELYVDADLAVSVRVRELFRRELEDAEANLRYAERQFEQAKQVRDHLRDVYREMNAEPLG